jgi:hypothetical protein
VSPAGPPPATAVPPSRPQAPASDDWGAFTPGPVTATDVFGGKEGTTEHDLRTLVLSRHAAIAIETDEEARADRELMATAEGMNMSLYDWTLTRGLALQPGGAPVYESQNAEHVLDAMSRFMGDALFVLKDFAPQLKDPAISRRFRELLEMFSQPNRLSTVVLLGSTVELPGEIDSYVTRYDLSLPRQAEYEQAIYDVVESLAANRHARIEIGADDYPQMASALRGLTLNQARRALAQVAIADGRLGRDDLSALMQMKAGILQQGGLLEFFPPSENDAQLGGFGSLRAWLQRQRLAFGEEARQLNLPRPKGLMLVGVQGCGKSLAARVIAREWQLPLLRLDFGRLYDKFIGESERNMRRAIAVSESLAPAVLWVDEIEKGIDAGGGGGEADGGLSRRLLASFLTWLQENDKGVFVVATANNIDALPAELMRKGRFDEIFFVDLPDAAERAEIFRIHLTFRRQDPATFDLARLAQAAEGFSGAEIEQIVVTTMLDALQRRRRPTTETFIAVAQSMVPLSRARAAEIAHLREVAKRQFVPVR